MKPFFDQLERALVPGGTITIVTDNLWSVDWLCYIALLFLWRSFGVSVGTEDWYSDLYLLSLIREDSYRLLWILGLENRGLQVIMQSKRSCLGTYCIVVDPEMIVDTHRRMHLLILIGRIWLNVQACVCVMWLCFRLWKLENQSERYFFLLQKVDSSSGLNLRIKPKGNISRMKNIPDSLSKQKTFSVVATGKKIKFED